MLSLTAQKRQAQQMKLVASTAASWAQPWNTWHRRWNRSCVDVTIRSNLWSNKSIHFKTSCCRWAPLKATNQWCTRNSHWRVYLSRLAVKARSTLFSAGIKPQLRRVASSSVHRLPQREPRPKRLHRLSKTSWRLSTLLTWRATSSNRWQQVKPLIITIPSEVHTTLVTWQVACRSAVSLLQASLLKKVPALVSKADSPNEAEPCRWTATITVLTMPRSIHSS